jgi:hypothetical protein
MQHGSVEVELDHGLGAADGRNLARMIGGDELALGDIRGEFQGKRWFGTLVLAA